MTKRDDLWAIPPELETYLGWWGWESRLDDKDRYRLAFTRSLMTPEDEEDFALAYADTVESSEYNSALEEATTPEERAVVKLEGGTRLLPLPGQLGHPDARGDGCGARNGTCPIEQHMIKYSQYC
jgi:hypothetical protein